VDLTPEEILGRLDITWVVVSALLVMFMQAGFAFLEMGFVRAKNAGSVIAKVLMNFSIASLGWWLAGFAIAFGGAGWFAGDSGFLLSVGDLLHKGPAESLYGAEVDGKMAAFFFFQLVFCGVSLAIVWGSTLERTKLIVYPLYGAVFSVIIYPLVAHWIFGGGWLAQFGDGVQDFAGSTVVHLTGATGALACLLLLGPRRGKYGPDGRPRPIPGHSLPLFGLGVMILWLGWFGFNAGSTLGSDGFRFAEVAAVTNLAAAAGVLTAALTSRIMQGTVDVGMCGNGAIAALVGITAPAGYVEMWAAPIIGGIAGVLVVVAVILIDKKLDDPVGALSAHGLAGVWGTLACGIFSSPRLVEAVGVGKPGLVYNGSFEQLGVQAVGVLSAFALVFTLSLVTFWLIKVTVGLRVDEETEEAGLDITEHGMYGYPEQFIGRAELEGAGVPIATAGSPTAVAPITTKEVPAT